MLPTLRHVCALLVLRQCFFLVLKLIYSRYFRFRSNTLHTFATYRIMWILSNPQAFNRKVLSTCNLFAPTSIICQNISCHWIIALLLVAKEIRTNSFYFFKLSLSYNYDNDNIKMNNNMLLIFLRYLCLPKLLGKSNGDYNCKIIITILLFKVAVLYLF